MTLISDAKNFLENNEANRTTSQHSLGELPGALTVDAQFEKFVE